MLLQNFIFLTLISIALYGSIVSAQNCVLQIEDSLLSSDVREELLASGNENDPTITVTIDNVAYNCLVHAENPAFYLHAGITIQYTVSPGSATGFYRAVYSCDGSSAWGMFEYSSSSVIGSEPFLSSTFQRENCSLCSLSAGDYLCVPCDSQCLDPSISLGYCYGSTSSQCCNFILNETCTITCPENFESNSSNVCVCENSWIGAECDQCPIPCVNGTHNVNCTSCNCIPGFSGNLCDNNIDECEQMPCLNNGSCNDLVNNFTCSCINFWDGMTCNTCPLSCNEGISNPNCSVCVCDPGYTGSMCETNIDDCEPEPCMNNGTCQDQVNDYNCTCVNEWMGKNCSECGLNCINGGQNSDCSICICDPGYTGSMCETNIDDCETEPCVNNGTCQDLLNDYNCTCVNEWMGKNCSDCGLTCINGERNSNCSVCVCDPGYTGSMCETNIDDCEPEPCMNNGTCQDQVNDYNCTCVNEWMGKNCSECGLNCINGGQNSDCSICICDPGYTGSMCETNIDDCEPEPCMNNGTCQDQVNDYNCTCVNEWMGKNCSECGLNCINGGQNSDCSICICDPGYTGSMCETNIDDCEPEPCMNNGTCQDQVNDYNCTCVNEWMGKNCSECGLNCINGGQNSDCSVCVCDPGYTGSMCETNIDDCEPEPCMNNGTCQDQVNDYNCTCVNEWMGKNCSECGLNCINGGQNSDCSICICDPGYTGSMCETNINECVPEPCVNNGTCQDLLNDYNCTCVNEWMGKNCSDCGLTCINGGQNSDCSICICDPGYTGSMCETNINECVPEPCVNNGTCQDLLNDYNCTCVNEWMGKNCSDCGLTCINGERNSNCSVCVCDPGYTGSMCETNIDDCEPEPCMNNGTCQDQVNDYNCTCVNEWMGKNCSECGLNCINGGQNSDCSICICDPGYTGSMCETNIDDCEPEPCMNNGTCQDQVNDYNCTCVNEWMGKNCSECGLNCINGGQNSDCSICICDPGYTGSMCETNIDDCEPEPCMNNGTCQDQVNDYNCTCVNEWMGKNCSECGLNCINGGQNSDCSVCVCDPGYTGSMCETNIDDCEPEPCMNNGTCQDQVNDYNCTCVNEWMGKNCSECGLNCINGGQNSDCSICICDPGYTGSMCETNINECVPEPCVNNGTCQDLLNNYNCTCVNEWMGKNCSDCGLTCINGERNSNCSVCVCDPGYTGSMCETNIDDCEPEPCMNNGTCQDQVNDYNCTCVNEWMGKNCSECGLNCINGGQNSDCSVCVCDPGYTGSMCETNIDDCEPEPCMNNGTCQDQVNDYNCTCVNEWMGKNCSECPLNCNNGSQSEDCSICICESEYTGTNCEVLIDPCDSNPCRNGGECIMNGTTYECLCPPGYIGENCGAGVFTCNDSDTCNNGACVEVGVDIIEGVPPSYCECTPAYIGTYCTDLINNCVPGACQNGGRCDIGENLEYGLKFTCACKIPFYGPNCQLCPLDGLCKNNGVISSDCSRCICLYPYTGTYCSESRCQNDQVIDGNTCKDTCTTDTYQPSSTDMGICTACGIDNCIQCDIDGMVCTECKDGYVVETEECIRILPGCGIENCALCYTGICTVCFSNYTLTFENSCGLIPDSPIPIDNTDNTLAIILGTIAGVALLCIILVAILIGTGVAVVYYKKSKIQKLQSVPEKEENGINFDNPLYESKLTESKRDLLESP